jgi:hypothetical protein
MVGAASRAVVVAVLGLVVVVVVVHVVTVDVVQVLVETAILPRNGCNGVKDEANEAIDAIRRAVIGMKMRTIMVGNNQIRVLFSIFRCCASHYTTLSLASSTRSRACSVAEEEEARSTGRSTSMYWYCVCTSTNTAETRGVSKLQYGTTSK